MITVYCDRGHRKWNVARYMRAPVPHDEQVLARSERVNVGLSPENHYAVVDGEWCALDAPESVAFVRSASRIAGEFWQGRLAGDRFEMASGSPAPGGGWTFPNECNRGSCAANARARGPELAKVLDMLEAQGVELVSVTVLARALGMLAGQKSSNG